MEFFDLLHAPQDADNNRLRVCNLVLITWPFVVAVHGLDLLRRGMKRTAWAKFAVSTELQLAIFKFHGWIITQNGTLNGSMAEYVLNYTPHESHRETSALNILPTLIKFYFITVQFRETRTSFVSDF